MYVQKYLAKLWVMLPTFPGYFLIFTLLLSYCYLFWWLFMCFLPSDLSVCICFSYTFCPARMNKLFRMLANSLWYIACINTFAKGRELFWPSVERSDSEWSYAIRSSNAAFRCFALRAWSNNNDTSYGAISSMLHFNWAHNICTHSHAWFNPFYLMYIYFHSNWFRLSFLWILDLLFIYLQ